VADASGPDRARRYDLVASFFTLTGSGFGQPPRHPFPLRCRAAAAAGFSGIGLHVDDLPRTVDSGIDIAQMQDILTDTGLRVVEIEFLSGWVLDDSDPAELDATVRKIEAVADAFGGRHVSAGEFRDAGRVDLDRAAGRLSELARRLTARGLKIAVEAFPWSVLAGPDTAPAIVGRSGVPTIGHLVDVWHFFNNGGDPTTLPGPIMAVQLNDGPRVHNDLLAHARATRQLPGDGELNVVALVKALLRKGFSGPWCVEVNTPDFCDLPIDEAATRAARAAEAVLEAAGAPRTAPLPIWPIDRPHPPPRRTTP
jgi:sugar phosphate isomerase/epimerase